MTHTLNIIYRSYKIYKTFILCPQKQLVRGMSVILEDFDTSMKIIGIKR